MHIRHLIRSKPTNPRAGKGEPVVELTIHTYTAAESGLFVNSYLLETPAGAVVVDANLLVADIAALKSRLAALHKPLLGVFLLVQLAGRAGEPVAFTDDLAFHRTHPYTAPGLAASVRPASGAAAPGAGGGRHTLGYGALAAVSLLQTAAGMAPAVLSLLGVALLGVAFLAALLTLRHPPRDLPRRVAAIPRRPLSTPEERKRSNGH